MGKIKTIINRNLKKNKRILIIGLIIFGLIVLLLPSITYADSLASVIDDQAYSKDLSQLIKMISHLVYVFIWPCLTIAGTALDNSLVYGKFLHLDVALWDIWNIMKNFANFTLGFLFIFSIVKNLFKGAFGASGGDPINGAKNTIVNTLIAGVLVQMSWFLVAALIDLSTILIYAVGGIPLSMVGSYNKDVADIPIMKLNAEITNKDSFSYYSYGDYNFSPCYIVNKNGDADDNIKLSPSTGYDKGEYIAGREFLYLSDGVRFETGYCTIAGYLYKYKESPEFFCDLEGGTEGSGCYEDLGDTFTEKNTNYHTRMRDYLRNLTGRVDEQIEGCFLMSAYGVNQDDSCEPLCSGYGEVAYTADIFSGNNGFTLQDLLSTSKGFVGPFVTMYSSILNFQDLVINPGSYTVIGNLFGALINTFFAFVLFIPVAILAALLVIRIGYLWIVVATSPLLILVEVLSQKDGPLKNVKKFLEKFSLKEIMTKIFSPVIVVFAVSLCIVFLSTIFKAKPLHDDASDTMSAFGIQCIDNNEESGTSDGGSSCESKTTKKCEYSILGLVKIKLNAQNYNHGKDMFVWVLMMLLSTGIVRFFMKFAIGMMGKTMGDGAKWMDTAGKLITDFPLISLPTGGKVGVGAFGIGKGNENRLSNLVDSKINDITRLQEQKTALNKFFNLDDEDNSGGVTSEDINNVATEIEKIEKEGKIVTYENLSQTSKDTLTAFYGNEEGAKTNFGTFREYHTNTIYKEIREKGGTVGTSSTQKTNSDAVKFTREQLDYAVRSDPNWKEWARSMVSGSVQTIDGVFMVDVLGGEINTSGNQQYEIISRDKYEERHFGKPVQSLSVNDYNAMKKDEQEALKKQFTELKEEIEKLEEIREKINNHQDLSDTEKDQQKSLEDARNGIKDLTKDIIDQKMQELGIQ